jgi:ABC-type transport system involved in multi-copper enzyme maturation permease subunit
VGLRRNVDVFKALLQDTFRQARASGISWMMLGITAICFVFCLSVRISGDVTLKSDGEPVYFLPPAQAIASLPKVGSGKDAKPAFTADPAAAKREGVDSISGRMTLAFGAISIPLSRDRADAVHFVELILASGIAGTCGLLLTLVWTAGFLPSFLEPSAAAVLLAKPIPRSRLLLGKYLGVLTFVAFQLILFVALTWLALGLRTQVWDAAYWWTVPLLLVQFAIYYSFSVLMAVVTRSTVSCVFGSILFWLLAWGINYGAVMTRQTPQSQYLPASTTALAEAAYWMTPKPIDSGVILFRALGASEHFEKPWVFKLAESSAEFSPRLSILSSLLMTAALLALSAHEFRTADY